MTNTALTAPSAGCSAEALINAHPEAELIRLVQRSAYRAYSTRHKVGLDALSWLGGPLAPVGFAAVDDHRKEEACRCHDAVQELLRRLGQSLQDRRIVALLLTDYPARNGAIAAQLRAHLSPGITPQGLEQGGAERRGQPHR